jgi:hypothetical protein
VTVAAAGAGGAGRASETREATGPRPVASRAISPFWVSDPTPNDSSRAARVPMTWANPNP